MGLPDWLNDEEENEEKVAPHYPTYPGREYFRAFARKEDPETSHDAADSLPSDRIRESQQNVLEVFRTHGRMTDTELIEAYSLTDRPKQSSSGLRTRRSELVDRGLVVFSGEYRLLKSGRNSRIWAAARQD